MKAKSKRENLLLQDFEDPVPRKLIDNNYDHHQLDHTQNKVYTSKSSSNWRRLFGIEIL